MNQISNEEYFEVFQKSTVGQKILQDLATRYYDTQSYSRGDTHETAFNEGKREVVAEIIRRCNQAQVRPEIEED